MVACSAGGIYENISRATQSFMVIYPPSKINIAIDTIDIKDAIDYMAIINCMIGVRLYMSFITNRWRIQNRLQ